MHNRFDIDSPPTSYFTSARSFSTYRRFESTRNTSRGLRNVAAAAGNGTKEPQPHGRGSFVRDDASGRRITMYRTMFHRRGPASRGRRMLAAAAMAALALSACGGGGGGGGGSAGGGGGTGYLSPSLTAGGVTASVGWTGGPVLTISRGGAQWIGAVPDADTQAAPANWTSQTRLNNGENPTERFRWSRQSIRKPTTTTSPTGTGTGFPSTASGQSH